MNIVAVINLSLFLLFFAWERDRKNSWSPEDNITCKAVNQPEVFLNTIISHPKLFVKSYPDRDCFHKLIDTLLYVSRRTYCPKAFEAMQALYTVSDGEATDELYYAATNLFNYNLSKS